MKSYSQLMSNVLKIINNQTGLKETEISKETIGQLKPVLDSLPLIIWIHGEIDPIYMNKFAREYYGFTEDDIKHEKTEIYSRYIHPDTFYLVHTATVSFKSKPKELLIFDLKVKDANGSIRWISNVSKAVNFNPYGTVKTALSISFDLGDLYQHSALKENVDQIANKISEIPVLTDREFDTLRLIALGKNSTAIGKDMNIASSTVDTHRRNLIKKLGAKSSIEAVTIAFRLGVLY